MTRSSPIGRPELACIRPNRCILDRALQTILPPSYRAPQGADGAPNPALRWLPKRIAIGTETLGLDLLSAFVLLHVDGVSDIAQIAYSSGIPQVEVVAMLEDLRRRGAVRFEEPLTAVPTSEPPAATVSEVRVIAAAANGVRRAR